MAIRKILLAEDDVDDQAFLSECIGSRTEWKLLPIVENGEEVLDFLDSLDHKQDLPDIIILDQNMPKINGLQTLHMIKANNAYAHIPVIIYTTNPDDNLRQRCKDGGAALVFPKPYSPEGYNKLMEILHDFMATRIGKRLNGSR